MLRMYPQPGCDTRPLVRLPEIPVPDFDDAPGTHGELLRLPAGEREELSEIAQSLLNKLNDAA